MSPTGRRTLSTVLVTLLVFGIAGAALGQSEEEVAGARGEAEAAAGALRSAAAATSTSEQQLVAAVYRYEQLTAELSTVSFDLVDVLEETRSRERAVREHRQRARELTVRAYIAAGNADLPTIISAGSLEDATLIAEIRARIAEGRTRSIRTLRDVTSDLDRQRRLLEVARRRQATLREEAQSLLPGLADLVTGARLREAFAADREEVAAERYQLAAAELEAALALVSPRALRWRSLVEKYFPEPTIWAALEVLDCESRGDPEAVSPESDASGLFQFLAGTWLFASAGAGFGAADRTDPEANIAAAAWLVERSEALAHPRGAWGHWECQPSTPQTPAVTGSG